MGIFQTYLYYVPLSAVLKCKLEDIEGEIDKSESVLAKLMEYKRRISAVVRVPMTNPATPAVTTTGSVTRPWFLRQPPV